MIIFYVCKKKIMKKARKLFEEGISIDPGNPYVSHAYGQLERKERNFKKARNIYETSLKLRGPWAQVCQV